MQYNTCETCGANNGRAGLLIKAGNYDKRECMNCYDTRRTGAATLHSNLRRTPEEIAKTFAIIKS